MITKTRAPNEPLDILALRQNTLHLSKGDHSYPVLPVITNDTNQKYNPSDPAFRCGKGTRCMGRYLRAGLRCIRTNRAVFSSFWNRVHRWYDPQRSFGRA